MTKASWMSFTSANWLDSPCPSAVSASCRKGLQTAAFHLWGFPTKQQGPSANKAYYCSFSGNLLHSVTSSAHNTCFSCDIPKSLSSGQSMITSKNPGQLGFPIQAHCVITATHFLHIVFVAWCVEDILPLNIQPNTGNRGGRRSCASVPITSKVNQTHSYAVSVSFLGRV